MAGISLVDVVNLKNNPSRESRLLVAEKMCDGFNGTAFTQEESFIALEILRMLAKDAEVAIRQAVAEKLKHNKRLPEDVAFMLANDVMQVALPILQYSPVLSESDLILIVRSSSDLTKLLAISKRDIVPEKVSKELIEKKRLFVVESLVNNKGSKIAEPELVQVMHEYGGVDSLLKALVGRSQLPAVIVERLMEVITGALREQLITKHRDKMHVIAEATEDAKAQVVITHASLPSSLAQKEALVSQMQQSGRLNSSVVLRALCLGDIDFFTSSMAKLSGWPQPRIEQTLKERNIESLRRLYRAAGLPDSIQDATLAVLVFVMEELRNGHKGGSSQFAGRVIERVVAAGYDRSVNNMSYILTLVGKKPNVATYH